MQYPHWDAIAKETMTSQLEEVSGQNVTATPKLRDYDLLLGSCVNNT